MSTIPQLAALNRRKSALALQKAQHGIDAAPHVVIELSDLETVTTQMNLIDIHRQNLEHLLRQRTHFGANAPTHIVNQIANERQEIDRLRVVCGKYGHPVGQHPVDADEPTIEAAPGTPAPFPSDPIARVREQLRDIEALLRHGQYAASLEALQALRREIG